jgi:hypothetical protein
MKKIILTGHTSSVGQAIANHYKDHNVVKISRATGFDLTKEEDVERVVELASDADCFINLANVGVSQSILLQQVHSKWTQDNHAGKIISFGTLAPSIPFELLLTVSVDPQMLANKLLLEKIHNELRLKKVFGAQPQTTLLRFANYGDNKPSTTEEQMLEVVDFVLNSSTYISALDFREI